VVIRLIGKWATRRQGDRGMQKELRGPPHRTPRIDGADDRGRVRLVDTNQTAAREKPATDAPEETHAVYVDRVQALEV